MAKHKYADNVMETTLTTGTGTLTLAGAVVGHQDFSAVGNGNTCDVQIYAVDNYGVPTGDWETAKGCTYTSSGTTLTRGTTVASSNGGSAVSFALGTKRVTLIRTAGRLNGCRVELTADQTIGSASTTALTGYTVIRDDLGAYSAGSPTRLTCPADDWYLIACGVNWDQQNAGKEVVDLRLNGATFPGSQTAVPANNALVLPVPCLYYCVQGDYWEITVFQNSGGNIDVNAGSQTFFALYRLGL